jgi:hypothetical protein
MKIQVQRWSFGEKFIIEFRHDPVPGTYGGRHKYCFHRRMKTTQEKRLNCDHEYRPYIRGRRQTLPNHWDDYNRSYQRSWKYQTKSLNQYKNNVEM